MTESLNLFAACQPGLEPLLLAELKSQHLDAESVPGGATFSGTSDTVMRACLWLGTASHVRIRLAHFRCRALGELQRKAMELPWKEWLHRNVPVSLSAKSRRSRVYHTGAISERIYNSIGTALGQEPMIAKEDDTTFASIVARFEQDMCTISLDATTTPLHRRGYRLDGRKAPLREDIAHALVLASDWSPERALLDPFCGSGTIAIEAAGIAMGLAPGRMRPPPLEQTKRFDPSAWQELLTESTPRTPAAPIATSDRDDGAVKATLANAKRAGVETAIKCEARALAAQPWLNPKNAPSVGTVITNPPFGMRVRSSTNLLPLYQTLGQRIQTLDKKARGGQGSWNATILAHDVRLARRTSLPLEAAFTTKHGGISVTAMRTHAPQ